METENLNKTVAKFRYRGVLYEIDWLTDANYSDGWKEYDIFEVYGGGGHKVAGHFSSKSSAKEWLIKCAKEEIKSLEESPTT